MTVKVCVIMGSDSDWPVMEGAVDALKSLGVGVEATVVSAHRTPDRLM
ncbi:MAG: AIR carboxylase family protein, partial [Litorivicinaceae bacterium]